MLGAIEARAAASGRHGSAPTSPHQSHAMTSLRIPTVRRALLALGLAALAALPLGAAHQGGAPPAPPAPHASFPPTELFEVVKIVDGDTVHIMRNGQKEKLRLLSVDTEEKLTPGMKSTPSKPQTTFGEETRLWTTAYMEQYRDESGKLSIGLAFPGGREARDVYGRLLCHVVMPDGTDFNLLLVQLGKSPYFNKYGNSRICHEQFVAAQRQARHDRLGIWDPTTNQPLDATAPVAKRDYARLLPWWQARADAIQGLRDRLRAGDEGLLDAEDPAPLLDATQRGAKVEVFATPDRFYEEKDGSLTVLMRAGSKDSALRVVIPAEAREAFKNVKLEELTEEGRQNYVYVHGELSNGPRGPQLITNSPLAWRRAGPEPTYAE
jgi:micrococcal nuclease